MKVTIERGTLLKALGHVQSVVERRNTIPILSNVLMGADGGTLSLTATDLESFKFSVEGHTDSVGGESFNANLSTRRAEVVRDFLAEHGVAKERLKSIGRGETDPVDTNVTDIGRQHNRRVEIINLGTEA